MPINSRLLETIRQKKGTISIESWMHEALYHPQWGYYHSKIRTIGAKGDFSTAATLHTTLGEAIALWVLHYRQMLHFPHPWHVIEIGGGNGKLAKSFFEHIPWYRKRSLQYHLVETSPNLSQLQQEILKGYPVRWHSSMEQALEQCGGKALIFSNELVDAFPCVQICRRDHAWTEVHLTVEENQLKECFLSPLPQRLQSAPCSIFAQEHNLPEGQRCELHLSYYEWMQKWVPLLHCGAWLTIDYGDTITNLYHRRPHGTLRAYFQHLRIEGPDIYQRFGQQDLTADVNFTDLQQWAHRMGLTNVSLQTQRQFLLHWLPKLNQNKHIPPPIAFLLHPHGMGSAYRVLSQTIGCLPNHT